MVLQVSSDDQKREQGSENNPNINAHRSRLAAARHPDNRPAASEPPTPIEVADFLSRAEGAPLPRVNQSGCAHRVHPQQHDSVVYLSDGNHQQCYHAGDHPRFGE
jgi:hypothetical protein